MPTLQLDTGDGPHIQAVSWRPSLFLLFQRQQGELHTAVCHIIAMTWLRLKSDLYLPCKWQAQQYMAVFSTWCTTNRTQAQRYFGMEPLCRSEHTISQMRSQLQTNFVRSGMHTRWMMHKTRHPCRDLFILLAKCGCSILVRKEV